MANNTARSFLLAGSLSLVAGATYLSCRGFQTALRNPSQPAAQTDTIIPKPVPGYDGDLDRFASRFSNADQIQDCLMGLSKGRADKTIYGVDDFWASTQRVLETGVDDCDGGAVVGMSLVRRVLDRKSYFLYLSNPPDPIAHAVTIYTDLKGGYCTLGIRPMDKQSGFKTVKELVTALGFREGAVLTDKDLGPNWETTEKNMSRSVTAVRIDEIDETGIRYLFEE